MANCITRHIPNTLTCLNLFSGCIACVMAFEARYEWALAFIIFSAVFDFFDGMMARALDAHSIIGKDLDSLADDVSFGVAPSLIVFSLFKEMDYSGAMESLAGVFPYLAFLLSVFSALRLAKFNNDTRQTSSFVGLPVPANALFWASLVTGAHDWLVSGSFHPVYLLLSDTLKEDAVNAVKELKALNINNIQILSGDKQAIVTNFAEKLGITQAYGDLLPDGKVKHIEAIRSNPANRIAFVGDGINDAPVLALSHVGIAMGGLGSDAAIETADVVIQTDQPSRVATAIHAGRQTRRIVWQNISLAFGVKLLVLILGAGGIATLWEAVFADVGVALIAIVNAIRIQKLIK